MLPGNFAGEMLPDLVRFIAAWIRLPKSIRAAILATVETVDAENLASIQPPR